MKNNSFAVVPLLAGLLSIPDSIEAHHGWMEFDEGTEITVEGTVTDFHYVNPHCVVEFEVKDDKGHVNKWQGEFSNPGVLSRRGWNAATLQAGDKLAITGHPTRNGVLAIHVNRIRSSTGEVKLELHE
ncbi:MAG TPA: DUF6152 family protein [Bryobacteraceae bacterium]|nr:DUF6152 family protein [Bryobacteraceae bacterium]